MRSWQKKAGIGLLFLLATLIMTYPLWLQMGSVINDPEDSLLNTWILAWDVEQIKSLKGDHFFDAHIFFPHQKVLAYSEHLFSLSLIALPINLLTGNPILAYNFTLLFAFFMCGFGMYLLAFHFTSDHWAAWVAGIIFAFAPYKFAQLCHIQVVSAWAIPLTFWAFHNFWRTKRLGYWIALIVFYLFQVLGNGYFALYLTLFLGSAFFYFLITDKRFGDRKTLFLLLLFMVIVFGFAAPFFYPYVAVRKEMGFVRSDLFWADLTSYLASGPFNRVYGKISAPFLRPEGELFPGLIALLLGYIGIRHSRNGQRGHMDPGVREKGGIRRLNRWFWILILLLILVSVAVIVSGGWAGNLWGIPFSAKTPKGFVLAMVVLVMIRLGYDPNFRKRVRERCLGPADRTLRFYFWMGIGAFLFTLGPEIHFFGLEIFPLGPYELLRRLVPGFDGLRVSSRFFIFVLLSLALFAALGFKALHRGMGNPSAKALLVVLPLLMLIEYLAVPLPIFPVPTGKDIPPVYSWLKKQPDDGAVVELPLPKPWIEMARIEAPRVYFSIYHGKRLFNGYSGYFPPVYLEMLERMAEGFSEERIKDFQALGLKYLVVHRDQLAQEEQGLMEHLLRHPSLKWRASFEGDQVFEILPGGREEEKRPFRGNRFLIKGVQISAGVHGDRAYSVMDGKKETYWGTGRGQEAGDFILLDMGTPRTVGGIVLYGGKAWDHYPRGLLVEGSLDGNKWFEVIRKDPFKPPITAFLTPSDFFFTLSFPAVSARWLKITDLQSHPKEWRIGEIELLVPDGRSAKGPKAME